MWKYKENPKTRKDATSKLTYTKGKRKRNDKKVERHNKCENKDNSHKTIESRSDKVKKEQDKIKDPFKQGIHTR